MVDRWVAELLSGFRVTDPDDRRLTSVVVRDFGHVEVSAVEAALLRSPLLSRQQWFRASPFVAYLYPSFTHSRFESRLVRLGWTNSILTRLFSLASNGQGPVPPLLEVQALRLAALLGDVASGPFGDALWSLIEDSQREVFDDLRWTFDELFQTRLLTSEIMATLVVISDPFVRLLASVAGDQLDAQKLALATASMMVGSSRFLAAPYLTEVLTGGAGAIAIADVLQGLSSAGLGIGLDATRLIQSFRVIEVDVQRTLRGTHGGTETLLVIRENALAQLQALELARAQLRSRVTGHAKVQVARQILVQLVEAYGQMRGRPLGVEELLRAPSEEAFLTELKSSPMDGRLGKRIKQLLKRLLEHDLPKPVLAFGPAFYAEGDELAPQDRADRDAMVTRAIHQVVFDLEKARVFVSEIRAQAKRDAVGRLGEVEVYVEMARPSPLTNSGILLHDGKGNVSLATNHFDSIEWSSAYNRSKRPGFVFCDIRHAAAVQAAARKVFHADFGLVLTPEASDEYATGDLGASYFPKRRPEKSAKQGTPFVGAEDLLLPRRWTESNGTFRGELARRIRSARLQGFPTAERSAVIRIIDALSSFQELTYLGGTLQSMEAGQERLLQRLLRDHLRARSFDIVEGMKVAAGELDLLFEGEIVIELKIMATPTDRPLFVAQRHALQARRYAMALEKTVIATVIGYTPRSELGHLPPSRLLDVRRIPKTQTVEVRACLPVHYPTPSHVRSI